MNYSCFTFKDFILLIFMTESIIPVIGQCHPMEICELHMQTTHIMSKFSNSYILKNKRKWVK